jgi:hypothetical protein
MKKIIFKAVIAILFAGLLLTGCVGPGEEPIPSQHEGKLLILQAYGTSDDAAGVSHSFVELFNTTDKEIKLDGISLYYADGVRGLDEKQDWGWDRLDLTGTIPAKHSYLILGKDEGSPVARLKLKNSDGDIYRENFSLSNRSFKVALIEGGTTGHEITKVANPFDTDGKGRKVDGYIDMVGAANDPTHATNPDNIFGYEKAPARNSASEAVRRKNLTDTNDNSRDFIGIRYAGGTSPSVNAAGDPAIVIQAGENWKMNHYRPKNVAHGNWNPAAIPQKPEVIPTEGLMIFQVHGAGFGDELGDNDNTNTGSISHNFIELYNNSDQAIYLDDFSIQWANGKANGGGTVIAADQDWNVINLSGVIPAYSSYLIRGRKMNDENGDVGRLQIEEADLDDNDFYMSNRSFKIALLSNQTKLVLSQPWDNDNSEPFVIELLDLVGARNGNNDSVEGFKGNMFDNYSKQQSIRRRVLADTGDNRADFVGMDYRNQRSQGDRMTDDDVAKFRPRSTEDGTWTPEFGD